MACVREGLNSLVKIPVIWSAHAYITIPMTTPEREEALQLLHQCVAATGDRWTLASEVGDDLEESL